MNGGIMSVSPFSPVPKDAEYVGVVFLDCPYEMTATKYKRTENGIEHFYYEKIK